MRIILALALVLGLGSIAFADGSGSALQGAGSASALPSPADSPAESASLVHKLYKTGHLIPALVIAGFFLLQLLQRWVAWLRTGYRKVLVASALSGLAMLAERVADGTTPNLPMVMGAFGVAFALWLKTEGEPKTAKPAEA